MKKSDLKTGMIVEAKNGSQYIVMLDAEHHYKDILINIDGGGWLGIKDYTDDFIYYTDEIFNITKIYKQSYIGNILCDQKDSNSWNLIWEREKPKEMTLEQIEKELGYKIKIVS